MANIIPVVVLVSNFVPPQILFVGCYLLTNDKYYPGYRLIFRPCATPVTCKLPQQLHILPNTGVPHQTCNINQLQYTDTGPTSTSTDPAMPNRVVTQHQFVAHWLDSTIESWTGKGRRGGGSIKEGDSSILCSWGECLSTLPLRQ